jgi:hypothetical protein
MQGVGDSFKLEHINQGVGASFQLEMENLGSVDSFRLEHVNKGLEAPSSSCWRNWKLILPINVIF